MARWSSGNSASGLYLATMPLTLDTVFASPDHYLHSFQDDAAVFVPMDRSAYHRSIFLDDRIDPARPGSMRVPLTTLAGGSQGGIATGWIFHVAHCGSTLLARALDHLDTNLVLREPLALRQVALAPSPAKLTLVLGMVGKRYRADMPTIVKANVPVNFLLPEIVARAVDARAIFLYLPFRDYLLAILRTANHRKWLRRVTGQLRSHLPGVAALPDAERAAALWLAQLRAYAAAIVRMPGARSLDAEAFFAEPRAILSAAAAHLEVPMAGAAVDECVAGPLFGTYSKNPAVAFDNAARLSRRREGEAALAGELAQAERWLDAEAGSDPLPALAAARL